MRDKQTGNGHGGPSFRSAKPVHRGGFSHEFVESLRSIQAPPDVLLWAQKQQLTTTASERQEYQKQLLDQARANPGVADFVQVYEEFQRYLGTAGPSRLQKAHYSTGGNS